MLNPPFETLFIGSTFLSLPQCQSTNTEMLKQLDAKQEPERLTEGFILQSDHQYAGRGQRGTSWDTAPGLNLTFSLLLRPAFLPVQQQYWLTISISLAMLDFLTDFPIQGHKIKWPNDIYVNDKKIAGILIENSIKGNCFESAVVGIGFNVNQTEFPISTATSLRLETGQRHFLEEALARLLKKIELRYLQLKNRNTNRSDLKAEYCAKLLGFNEFRFYRAKNEVFSAKVSGIDAIGRIKMEDKQGNERTFSIKEVQLIEG